MQNGLKQIRVLIVDDSTLMRETLRSILNQDPQIEIVGMAKNGDEAVEKARILKPDVITMDLKMPMMTGLEAIEEIMIENPIPIIVVSSLDVKVVIKALGIGAMDFIAVTDEIDAISESLIEKIKVAARVKPMRRYRLKNSLFSLQLSAKINHQFKVVAIGVSTGGPQALQDIIQRLPKNFPAGILIVQHMSKGFIDGLAEWLRGMSSLDIRVAKAGDDIKAGTVLIAPDDYHMIVEQDGKIGFRENLTYKKLHVPSIDVMIQSVAHVYGKKAIGVILTGMGKDGVEGMKAIKDEGGLTIAQDEGTSVIFGMNKVAIESGYVHKVVGIDQIAEALINAV